jgi:hypothetical protein
MTLSVDECYKIMGLAANATPKEIQQTYYDLVNIWHPDRFSHDPHLQQKAQEELKKINEAYRILENSLSSGSMPAPPAPPPRRRAPTPKHPVPHTTTQGPVPLKPVSAWMWPLAAIVATTILIFGLPKETPHSRPAEPYNVPMTTEHVKLPSAAPAGNTSVLSQEAIVARKNLLAQRWGGQYVPKTEDSTPSVAPGLGYITVGSTRDDVIRLEGQPESGSSSLFTYGSSHIYFEDGKVSGWDNRSPHLKVRLKPSVRNRESTFTIGSTKDTVLSVQGTPDSFSDSEFTYGISTVHFEDGRVTSWFDRDPPLKVRMQPDKE